MPAWRSAAASALLAAVAAAFATGAAAVSPAETRYAAAVKRDYLPLRTSYRAARSACTVIANDARCRARITTALAAARRLSTTLEPPPPPRLAKAHRSLRSAVGQVTRGFNRVIRVLKSGEYSPFNFFDYVDPAGRRVDAAIARLNKLVPAAKLPRLTPPGP